jgi:hypothetical protein
MTYLPNNFLLEVDNDLEILKFRSGHVSKLYYAMDVVGEYVQRDRIGDSIVPL